MEGEPPTSQTPQCWAALVLPLRSRTKEPPLAEVSKLQLPRVSSTGLERNPSTYQPASTASEINHPAARGAFVSYSKGNSLGGSDLGSDPSPFAADQSHRCINLQSKETLLFMEKFPAHRGISKSVQCVITSTDCITPMMCGGLDAS